MQPAKAVQRLQAVSGLSRQLPCTASLAARGKVRARKLCRLWVCKGTPGFRCRNTPPLALSGFLFPPGPDTAAFQVAPISFRLVALSNHFISLSLSLCLCPSLSTRTWQTVELHVISQPRGKKKKQQQQHWPSNLPKEQVVEHLWLLPHPHPTICGVCGRLDMPRLLSLTQSFTNWAVFIYMITAHKTQENCSLKPKSCAGWERRKGSSNHLGWHFQHLPIAS